MTKNWMITKPRNPARESIEEVSILQWILNRDVHKWIVAKERGTFGYDHWQIRVQCNLTFDEMKQEFGENAHIEEASDNYEYERKEGNFVCSSDTNAIMQCRFGELRPNQRAILDRVHDQGDRQVTVVVDHKGNNGKSWLCRYLYENGSGLYVPPTITTPQGIIQFVASAYRGEEIVIIDIPRSTRWNPNLYVAVETIKDGLVFDARYSAKTRNIYGVKVLVMCNTKPNVTKLSADRWDLIDQEGRALSS